MRPIETIPARKVCFHFQFPDATGPPFTAKLPLPRQYAPALPYYLHPYRNYGDTLPFTLIPVCASLKLWLDFRESSFQASRTT